jgi:hypothetical protein
MRLVPEPPRFRHEVQDNIRNTLTYMSGTKVRADACAGQGVEQRSAGHGHHKEQVSTPELGSFEYVTRM